MNVGKSKPANHATHTHMVTIQTIDDSKIFGFLIETIITSVCVDSHLHAVYAESWSGV